MQAPRIGTSVELLSFLPTSNGNTSAYGQLHSTPVDACPGPQRLHPKVLPLTSNPANERSTYVDASNTESLNAPAYRPHARLMHEAQDHLRRSGRTDFGRCSSSRDFPVGQSVRGVIAWSPDLPVTSTPMSKSIQ